MSDDKKNSNAIYSRRYLDTELAFDRVFTVVCAVILAVFTALFTYLKPPAWSCHSIISRSKLNSSPSSTFIVPDLGCNVSELDTCTVHSLTTLQSMCNSVVKGAELKMLGSEQHTFYYTFAHYFCVMVFTYICIATIYRHHLSNKIDTFGDHIRSKYRTIQRDKKLINNQIRQQLDAWDRGTDLQSDWWWLVPLILLCVIVTIFYVVNNLPSMSIEYTKTTLSDTSAYDFCEITCGIDQTSAMLCALFIVLCIVMMTISAVVMKIQLGKCDGRSNVDAYHTLFVDPSFPSKHDITSDTETHEKEQEPDRDAVTNKQRPTGLDITQASPDVIRGYQLVLLNALIKHNAYDSTTREMVCETLAQELINMINEDKQNERKRVKQHEPDTQTFLSPTTQHNRDETVTKDDKNEGT